ncbi:hypothetical protein GCM10009601_33240 [Streptomyces thermospinosisporus]|uniref:Uncharacterized protein n=1 Tax=Streptomyces thermospinosisporus TaxID=161482 RepID=A0ABN1Z0H1_9ACTN
MRALRAACRQRLSDSRKPAFTARSTAGPTWFAGTCAAIIIGDAGPGPQTAVTERALTAMTGISPRPRRRPGARRKAAHFPAADRPPGTPRRSDLETKRPGQGT